MSFSSRSSSGKHYRNAHYGSGHYKKKGIFGNLFNIFSSRSGSNGRYDNNWNQYNNPYMNSQPLVNQNVKICGRCSAQIPAGSKFCLQCGEKVADELFCMNCGEKLPSNAKFCLKCGSKVT